jgi:GTP-binding protein
LNLKQVTLERTAYLPDQLILTGPAQIAFAGRSNVGKSSLLNRLFNRKNLAKVSQTPGKTRSVNYFRVDPELYLVDLPGYGYAKVRGTERKRWGALLELYFQKSESLKALVHLIDSRHEPTLLDRLLHEWTQPLVGHHLYVLTKSDKISANKRQQTEQRLKQRFSLEEGQVVLFSTEMGDGKQKVINWISDIIA